MDEMLNKVDSLKDEVTELKADKVKINVKINLHINKLQGDIRAIVSSLPHDTNPTATRLMSLLDNRVGWACESQDDLFAQEDRLRHVHNLNIPYDGIDMIKCRHYKEVHLTYKVDRQSTHGPWSVSKEYPDRGYLRLLSESVVSSDEEHFPCLITFYQIQPMARERERDEDKMFRELPWDEVDRFDICGKSVGITKQLDIWGLTDETIIKELERLEMIFKHS
jgi:hypothetical protein